MIKLTAVGSKQKPFLGNSVVYLPTGSCNELHGNQHLIMMALIALIAEQSAKICHLETPEQLTVQSLCILGSLNLPLS